MNKQFLLLILLISLFTGTLNGLRFPQNKIAKTLQKQYETELKVKLNADWSLHTPGDMVLVPAGEFNMGDNFDEGGSDEKPVLRVNLGAFEIGKFEVTNEEYVEFLKDVLSKSTITVTENGVKGNDDKYYYYFYYSEKTINYNDGNFIISDTYKNHPVVMVNWYGAVAYCNWLSERKGLEKCYDSTYNVDLTKNGYRLPIEAEWEKAARGDDSANSTSGHQRRYPWGDTVDGSYANYNNSGDPFETDTYPCTTPVGYYDGSTHEGFVTHNNASPYGAYDMAGNVLEWCQDWYGSGSNSGFPYSNPTANNIVTSRGLRGGHWFYYLHYLRSADRNSSNPDFGYDYYGFRLVRTCISTNSNEPQLRREKFTLSQNYPNPFNPETTISFYLPNTSVITLKVYNINGQEIKTLITEEYQSGNYCVKWDGTDNAGRKVASGIYVYIMRTSTGCIQCKKLLYIK